MDGRLSAAVTTKQLFAAKYGLNLMNESAAHYALYLVMKENKSNATC